MADELKDKIRDILWIYAPALENNEQAIDAIAALFKEHYSHSERIKAGIAAARAKSKNPDEWGRRPDEVDEKTVITLLAEGKSIREVASETGVNRGKVERIRKKHLALDLV